MRMVTLSGRTEALARRLAVERNTTVEDAIQMALEACIGTTRSGVRPRDRSPDAMAARHARMDEAARDLAAMPVLDVRAPQEILDELNAV